MKRVRYIFMLGILFLSITGCIPASPLSQENTHENKQTVTPASGKMSEDEAIDIFKTLILDACTIHNLFLSPRLPVDFSGTDIFEKTAYDVSPPRIIETKWNPYYRYTEEDFDREYLGIRFGDYEWMQNKLKSTYTDSMITKHFSYSLEKLCGYIYLEGYIYANISVGGDGVCELCLSDATFIAVDEKTIEMSFPQVYWQDEEVGYIYLDEDTYPPVTIRLVYEDNLWKIDEWSDIPLSFWFSEEEKSELMEQRQTK